MRMFLSSFSVIVLSGILPAGSEAQLCCTTGSAAASAYDIGVIPSGSFRLSLGYEYNSLNDAYNGSEKIVDPLARQGFVRTFTLRTHYGISSRWGLSLSLPYLNTSRTFMGGGTFAASGMGDAALLIKYSLLKLNVVTNRELAIGAGLKAPTGATDKVDDGTSLSFDLQPGTGAWDVLFWAYYFKAFPFSKWSGMASAVVKFSDKGDNGLKYGDELIYSLTASRRLSDQLQISFRIKGRTSRAATMNGYEIFGTGGTILFSAPGVIYSPSRFLSIEAGIDLPVYFSVTGIQQALSYRTFFDIALHLD